MANNKYFNNIDLQDTFKIINSVDPTNPKDLVTRQFLEDYVAGVRDPKDAVQALMDSNVTLNAAPQFVDDVVLQVGYRILLIGQTNGAENGIYVVQTVGTGSDGIWVRSSDANTSAEVTSGLFTYVTYGTTYAKSGWLLTTTDPIILGTTSLSFVQVTGLADVIAGAALTKTGNQLDVNVDGVTIEVSSDNLRIHTAYPGQSSIVTVGTITSGTWNGTAIGVAYGGTGATTASGARTNLGAAASGANSDITSLSGLTTALSVAQGGTGATTPAGARSNLGATGKFAITLASGQSTYNIVHSLGTEDISKVQIYDTTNKEEVYGVLTKVIDTDTIQLQFGTTTSVGYRVIVVA